MDTDPPPSGGSDLYQPLSADLQQIRLLTILPGTFGDEVRCTLGVASLLESCSYETISYCWGDASLRSNIIVNGERVNVPQSSMAALRRVRLTDLERVVWIDAICINQCDNAEKSTQVASMSDIYQRGNGNLVFLGDDEDGVAEEVQRMIDSKAEQLSQLIEELNLHELVLVPRHVNRAAIVADLNHDLLKQLYDLPWFRRLWVVQEAVMARSSRCYWGTAKMRLIDIMLIADLLGTPIPWFSSGVHAAAKMFTEYRSQRRNNNFWPFFEVAKLSDIFMATDSRDYVFACVPLFRTWPQPRTVSTLIAPDYTKSSREVFQDATRYTLEDIFYEANDILLRIEHFSQTELEDSIASWTYKFGRAYKEMCAPTWEHRDFCAGFRERKQMPRLRLTMCRHPVADPNVLTLNVAVLDTIAEMTTPVLRIADLGDFANVWSVVQKVQAMTNFNCTIAALVLTAGTAGADPAAPYSDPWQVLQGYRALERYVFTHDNASQALLGLLCHEEARSEAQEELATLYYEMLLGAAMNRRFFKTISGLVGCGPQVMKPGDRVVIPENACFPCVLRPAGEHYLFLGVAYVHGMMHGEVFDRKDVEWKMVDIR